MVGRSLTALTVRVKERAALSSPSETLTVMVAVPVWLAAGVTVSVRLVPLPPRTSPAAGTSVLLLAAAVTTSVAGSLSTSPTVKAIGPVEVSSARVRLAKELIVGA